MKLAVLSDFHLGYERFQEDAYRQAERAMLLACERADALLIPGDIFDSKTPRPEVFAQAFSLFRIPLERELGARVASFSARDGRQNICRAPVVAIHGTHEIRAKGLVNPVQMLEAAGFVVNAQSATVVLEKEAEHVAVFGLGGVPERQARDALEVLSPRPIPGAFNILMFHQSLSELIPALGEECLSVEDLPRGFDLYVNGHIHLRHAKKYGERMLLIPGSTVVTQLREGEVEGKGIYIYDTRTREYEFVELGSRPFEFVRLEFSDAGLEDIYARCRQAVADAIAKHGGANPVVRLKVSGTLKRGFTAADLDFSAVEKEFEGRAYVTIDKRITSEELKERIEQIRALRERSVSVRELGMGLLRDKLKASGFSLEVDLELLFELLSSPKRSAPEEVLRVLLHTRPFTNLEYSTSFAMALAAALGEA